MGGTDKNYIWTKAEEREEHKDTSGNDVKHKLYDFGAVIAFEVLILDKVIIFELYSNKNMQTYYWFKLILVRTMAHRISGLFALLSPTLLIAVHFLVPKGFFIKILIYFY